MKVDPVSCEFSMRIQMMTSKPCPGTRDTELNGDCSALQIYYCTVNADTGYFIFALDCVMNQLSSPSSSG